MSELGPFHVGHVARGERGEVLWIGIEEASGAVVATVPAYRYRWSGLVRPRLGRIVGEEELHATAALMAAGPRLRDACARARTLLPAEAAEAVRAALEELAARPAQAVAPARPSPLFACYVCGSPDVEGTGWIHLNSGEEAEGEPPSDAIWCPQCEETYSRCCVIDERGCSEHPSDPNACPCQTLNGPMSR